MTLDKSMLCTLACRLLLGSPCPRLECFTVKPSLASSVLPVMNHAVSTFYLFWQYILHSSSS